MTLQERIMAEVLKKYHPATIIPNHTYRNLLIECRTKYEFSEARLETNNNG